MEHTRSPMSSQLIRSAGAFLLAIFCCPVLGAQAQALDDVNPVPLLSGSAGFFTSFEGGEPHLEPVFSPVLLVPLGKRWLIESRAIFEADMVRPSGGGPFQGKVEKEVSYVQLDFIANPYLTVTVGRFLTPFGIYNERLYPIWVRNLPGEPLILPIGVGRSEASTGVMFRGGFKAQPQFNINYSLYFSTLSTVNKLDSDRFVGGRVGIFIPKARFEIGGSFQHLLQDDHSNSFGLHFAWQPQSLPLDVRGEYARSSQGSGYWIEPAYRLSQIPFAQNVMRRVQVVARIQHAAPGTSPTGSFFSEDTKQFEFGVNYYFMDGLKATTSYGREFTPSGNENVWVLGLTYRFVLPLGPGGN
jgi:hypothetical protein